MNYEKFFFLICFPECLISVSTKCYGIYQYDLTQGFVKYFQRKFDVWYLR